jgi:hypothetical protein
MKSVVSRVVVLLASLCISSFAHADSITANFNGTAISGGDTIWFNSVLKVNQSPSSPFTIYFNNASISFTANGTNYNLAVPNAQITFNNSLLSASTTFNTATNTWITATPTGLSGNTFLDGLAFQVPTSGLPGGIKNVTLAGTFSSDKPGISLNWQWAAAVYDSFSTDYNALGIKPIDGNTNSPYLNSDHAGTPENFKTCVINGRTTNCDLGGAMGGGASNYTGSYSGTASNTPPVNPVPEPSSMLLFASGIGVLVSRVRRRS